MLQIRPFQPPDQSAAKHLILSGLQEHWGHLDPTLNPDLNDITISYPNGRFLVGYLHEQLVATGALTPLTPQTAEIVRMSIHSAYRRHGYGRTMLTALITLAQAQHCTQITLETTTTWHTAIQFYLANGFHITHQQGGDTYFLREIEKGKG